MSKHATIATNGKVTITSSVEGYHVWNLYRYNPECRSEYVIASDLTVKWSDVCRALIRGERKGDGWLVIGT